jgi:hypothetical protein
MSQGQGRKDHRCLPVAMSEEGCGGSGRREERLAGAHRSGGKAWPYGVVLDGDLELWYRNNGHCLHPGGCPRMGSCR